VDAVGERGGRVRIPAIHVPSDASEDEMERVGRAIAGSLSKISEVLGRMKEGIPEGPIGTAERLHGLAEAITEAAGLDGRDLEGYIGEAVRGIEIAGALDAKALNERVLEALAKPFFYHF
jgi:hypothetical protein